MALQAQRRRHDGLGAEVPDVRGALTCAMGTAMDGLIAALANSGNLAVIVLVIANGGLLWLVRTLMSAQRDQAREWTEVEKLNAAADLKLAEALVTLRAEIMRCTRL